ncbi:MAG: ATP-binding cassette domain-containing protein [Dermatophilaceae bacterium]
MSVAPGSTSPVTLVDLRRAFGPVLACDGLTWHAPRGHVTAILGPNGAGKTTAIECAVGLQRPDSGVVHVLGRDPWHAPAEHRARVGVMLQSGGIPNGSKPLALLRHLAALYAAPVSPADLASRLGIDAFAGTTVRRLSGGQKQRLALAAALVGRPEVVFLDEPTAGLDPHGRLDVYDLLREVKEEGTTIVVTTHSFEEAAALADHLVVISGGRAVAEGSPADVVGDSTLEKVYFGLTRKASA